MEFMEALIFSVQSRTERSVNTVSMTPANRGLGSLHRTLATNGQN